MGSHVHRIPLPPFTVIISAASSATPPPPPAANAPQVLLLRHTSTIRSTHKPLFYTDGSVHEGKASAA